MFKSTEVPGPNIILTSSELPLTLFIVSGATCISFITVQPYIRLTSVSTVKKDSLRSLDLKKKGQFTELRKRTTVDQFLSKFCNAPIFFREDTWSTLGVR